MTLKLDSITFETAPRLPGIRPGDMSTIDCENPNTPLIGWRAMLRGGPLFLVSPKGWKPGSKAPDWDPNGPAVIHEVARSHCFFHWSGSVEDIDTIAKGKFETPPFGKVLPVSVQPTEGKRGILSQLDPSQMGDA